MPTSNELFKDIMVNGEPQRVDPFYDVEGEAPNQEVRINTAKFSLSLENRLQEFANNPEETFFDGTYQLSEGFAVNADKFTPTELEGLGNLVNQYNNLSLLRSGHVRRGYGLHLFQSMIETAINMRKSVEHANK